MATEAEARLSAIADVRASRASVSMYRPNVNHGRNDEKQEEGQMDGVP